MTVFGLATKVNQLLAGGYIFVGGLFLDIAKLLYQAVHSKLAVKLTEPSIMPETSLSELAPKAEEYLFEIKLRPKDGSFQEFISTR